MRTRPYPYRIYITGPLTDYNPHTLILFIFDKLEAVLLNHQRCIQDAKKVAGFPLRGKVTSG